MTDQVVACLLVFGPPTVLALGYGLAQHCSNRAARRAARYIPFEEPVIIRPVVRRAA